MRTETVAVPAADGIWRIAVPTPFIVGRVNCYLVEGNGTTLVDTGPNTGTSLYGLEMALASCGHPIESIDRLIITHQHVDHEGLASIIARRSGATVEMLGLLAPALADWNATSERDEAVGRRIMETSGIDGDLLDSMASTTRLFRSFGADVEADVTFADGDVVEIGTREWTVHHRPGHSPSDTVFHDPDSGILLGGDHLLERISSNPLISSPLPGQPAPDSRPRPLPRYLEHLRRTREMDISSVLPGHGDPFGDHRKVIDDRLAMHERRATKLEGALSDGPLTAFEMAKGMWGRLALTQTYLALSEVLGHMDLLVEENRVVELAPDPAGVIRFQRA